LTDARAAPPAHPTQPSALHISHQAPSLVQFQGHLHEYAAQLSTTAVEGRHGDLKVAVGEPRGELVANRRDCEGRGRGVDRLCCEGAVAGDLVLLEPVVAGGHGVVEGAAEVGIVAAPVSVEAGDLLEGCSEGDALLDEKSEGGPIDCVGCFGGQRLD